MQRQRFGSDEGPGRNPAEERRLKSPATESEETAGGADDLRAGPGWKLPAAGARVGEAIIDFCKNKIKTKIKIY